MAHDPKFRISLRNAAGNYFAATLQMDNTYSVVDQVDPAYLQHLPLDWHNTNIKWVRNTSYWGVFRAYIRAYEFVKDGRAILLSLWFGAGGANAYCRITVEIWSESGFNYNVFFDSEIDFADCKDDKVKKVLTAGILDGRLQMLLKAKSGSPFNIPFWKYDSGTELWTTTAEFVKHKGIKLLYNATFTSGATADNPLIYFPSRNNDLQGFDDGNHGAGQGVHTLPAMSPYNMVQNNGTTTYIGNDILQPLLLQDKQAGVVNQVSFTDNNSTPPYNQALIKNLLSIPVNMNVTIDGTLLDGITWDDAGAIGRALRFVLFELNSNNNSELSNYTFIDLYSIALPPGGAPIVYATPFTFSSGVNVTLQPQMAYILGIIYDGDGAGFFSGGTLSLVVGGLQVSFKSFYNSGTAAPVDAAMWPESTIIGRRPGDLWNRLVKCIDSTTTDQYGFPVLVGGYSGVSDFLNDDSIAGNDNYDLVPYDCLYTTENAIKQIWGQPYISTTIADFFTTWFKLNGCGLGPEGNSLRIEPLEYFFDSSTEILDLGTNIFGFRIEQMTELMANHIKAGYGTPNTNKDYGVDAFNTEQAYDAPLNVTPGDLDLVASAVITEQNEIEKMRAQVNQDKTSNPSGANTVVLLQIDHAAGSATDITDPGEVIHSVTPYDVKQYPTAQSTDPTASLAPYVKGLYYPDTAINLGLTPASNTYRNGPLIRSLCDQRDDQVLTYRKQYQQQYNDPLSVLELPGISKNIGAGLINEVADIAINTLGVQLFRPYFFKFSASYPPGMYNVINGNPRGYISFTYIDENGQNNSLRGFLWEVTQRAGDNAATDFTLIAHPNTSDAELGIN